MKPTPAQITAVWNDCRLAYPEVDAETLVRRTLDYARILYCRSLRYIDVGKALRETAR